MCATDKGNGVIVNGKFLALDVGSKFVGYAVFSELGSPGGDRGAFRRAKHQAIADILQLLKEQAVAEIIAGIPLNADQSFSGQAEDVLRFCRRLSRRTELPFYLVDESFSTHEVSEREALQSEEKRKKFKESGALDGEAARVIGRRYSDVRLLSSPPYLCLHLKEAIQKYEESCSQIASIGKSSKGE